MSDAIFRTFDEGRVRVATCLVPATTRYFDFLGILDGRGNGKVTAQVYGYREMGMGGDQIVLVKRDKPIDLSLDLGDRKTELRWASARPEPEFDDHDEDDE